MKKIKYATGGMVVLALLTLYCRREPLMAPEALAGRWEVKKAFRNDRLTESLAGLYFEFKPSGRVSTNVAGVPIEGNYELTRDKIQVRESELDAEYTIAAFSDSTLDLSTVLRDYKFRFLLRKVAR